VAVGVLISKIGLYNSNYTLVTSDINAECIFCSAKKRGENNKQPNTREYLTFWEIGMGGGQLSTPKAGKPTALTNFGV
jgi:hypothetical protein